MRGLVPRIHVFLTRPTKTWMAGTSPRLSGKVLASCSLLDFDLRAAPGPFLRCAQQIEAELPRIPLSGAGYEVGNASPMHEVHADEAGKGERTINDSCRVMRQPQQKKGNERARNLDADRMLGGSEEVTDFQGLLDPSKEQLDGPPTFVETAISCA